MVVRFIGNIFFIFCATTDLGACLMSQSIDTDIEGKNNTVGLYIKNENTRQLNSDHEHSHEGHELWETHTMPMAIWQSYNITYLVDGVESHDGLSYALGWFFTFALAFILEALVFMSTYQTKAMQVKKFHCIISQPSWT